jgi:hypothetical protein
MIPTDRTGSTLYRRGRFNAATIDPEGSGPSLQDLSCDGRLLQGLPQEPHGLTRRTEDDDTVSDLEACVLALQGNSKTTVDAGMTSRKKSLDSLQGPITWGWVAYEKPTFRHRFDHRSPKWSESAR